MTPFFLLCLALLGALSCGAETPYGSEQPPDVLIILADDLDWIELEESPTPSLEQLAREGVTMRQFIAMPICSVARHALVHGRWPRRSGVGGNINSFAPPSETNRTPSANLASIPKVLKARGYHTALVGKWHLGQVSAEGGDDPLMSAPGKHGFDRWLAGSPANLLAREGNGYDEWVRVDDGVRRMEREYATRAMRDAALAWWKETPSPKFLLVSLSAPHPPIHLAPPDMIPPGFSWVEGERNQLRSMIGTVDHVVGRLREAVDPASTLFVFLADNGLDAKVGSTEESKGTTTERGVCVPFLAAGPGLARGEICTEAVSIVDVLATVAEAAAIPLAEIAGPGAEDSRSFLGALRDPAHWRPARPWVFTERYDTHLPGRAEVRSDDLALRTGRWKLRRDNGEETLVDLARDPEERSPLSVDGELEPDARQALAELRAILNGELPPRAP